MRHVFAFDAIQFLRGEFLKCFSNLKRKEKERKDCKEVTTDFLYESTIRTKKKKQLQRMEIFLLQYQLEGIIVEDDLLCLFLHGI